VRLNSASALGTTDLLRIGCWVCVNGIAAWLGGSLIARESPQGAAVIFGLILGLLQSTAISQTWGEAVAWAALTSMAFPLAVFFVVIPTFLTVYGLVQELWFASGLMGLIVGAALGLAQSAVFVMRDAPGRVTALWTLGNSVALALVVAIALADPLAGDGLARGAYGAAFGVLTSLPLAAVLMEARASER
jgi:hypothetical protein